MRIIARSTLINFYTNPLYRDSEKALEAWYYEARRAEWHSPADIKRKYGNASITGNDRVVFNICGNKYRLIVKFHYAVGVGYVRFIGTHEEYDAIDAEKI
jgi:mRNA interferase HigB